MLVVLFGALLHASWNVLTKLAGNAMSNSTLILIGSAVVAMATLPFLPVPARESWPFIAASGVTQVLYFLLVGAAYRNGDMSLAYPVMRGTAPLLVALASSAVLGEALSLGAACGVAIICAGVLAMALGSRGRTADVKTLGFALANAALIAGYTLLDGVGARRSGHPFSYSMAISIAGGLLFLPWALWRRPPGLGTAIRRDWMVGLIGGACAVASYALALWAMTRAPIAAVAALRETAILFGMVLARTVLHERLSPTRLAGGLLILAGAGTLRLA